MTQPPISLQLSHAEALVLFDCLARFSEGDADVLSFEHPSEEMALLRISAQLDKALREPFDPQYRQLLDAARTEVASAGDAA